MCGRTRSDADMELPPFFSIGKDTRHARTTHTIIIIIVVYHNIRVWPIPNKEKSGRRRGVNDVRPKTGLSRWGSVAVVGPIVVVKLCCCCCYIQRSVTLRTVRPRVFLLGNDDATTGRSTSFGGVALTLSPKHILYYPHLFFPIFFCAYTASSLFLLLFPILCAFLICFHTRLTWIMIIRNC